MPPADAETIVSPEKSIAVTGPRCPVRVLSGLIGEAESLHKLGTSEILTVMSFETVTRKDWSNLRPVIAFRWALPPWLMIRVLEAKESVLLFLYLYYFPR